MGRAGVVRRRRAAGRGRRVAAVGLALAAAAAGAPLGGQEGGALRLGLTYEARYVPGMVVAPVSASAGFGELGAAVGEILRTDLDYSDRFDILAVPDTLTLSGAPNYALWNDLGAVWLVTSDISVAPGTQTPLLRVSLHDVVHGNLENVQAFSLPSMDAADFRMSVHRISDRIVFWATGGQRGIAATRIALRRRDGDGSSYLVLLDSDGRNPQRIDTGGRNVYSPAFSPDATRIAYTIQDETGYFSLVEMNLITRSRRTVASGRLIQTPTWTPDGRLAYAEGIGGTTRIVVEGDGAADRGPGPVAEPELFAGWGVVRVRGRSGERAAGVRPPRLGRPGPPHQHLPPAGGYQRRRTGLVAQRRPDRVFRPEQPPLADLHGEPGWHRPAPADAAAARARIPAGRPMAAISSFRRSTRRARPSGSSTCSRGELGP